MTDLQRSILAISSALALLLATLILRSTGSQVARVRVANTELLFDASSAYEKARRLAVRFPKRAMGTEDGKAAAKWIESEMKKFGLRTELQKFTSWIAGERVEGRNVVGIHEGVRDGAIAIIAHYDIPFHVLEGAMDDASGVGVLLELARVLSQEEQKKTLVFIASDGEEWGMLGARHFVRENPDPKQFRAVVSLDCVKLEEPEKVYVVGTGQFSGYAPLWLWVLAEDCISLAGGKPESPTPFMHYASQAVNISSTDQGPFLRAGVPGINFGGSRSDSPLAREVFHTALDTSENLRPELFDVYGRAAELMIRSLDMLDYSKDNNPYYLRTGKRTYVGRTSLLALQIFLFLPLLLATSFQYYNLRTREKFLGDVFSELCNIGLFVMPWLSALAALYLLVWKNLIPRYELYPATLLDPFLNNPDWRAVAIVTAAFVAIWIAILFVRRFLSLWGRPDFASSKAVCLDVLLTLSVVALLFNGFAATLFLAPAAWLWLWIEQDRRLVRRILNVILAVASALPFVLLTVMFSKTLMLGPRVLWYLLLGAGYRFFSVHSVLIAAGAATVGGRLLQKSLMGIEEMAESETESK